MNHTFLITLLTSYNVKNDKTHLKTFLETKFLMAQKNDQLYEQQISTRVKTVLFKDVTTDFEILLLII